MNLLATQTHAQFAALCRQFSETTGWPLHFTPTEPALAAEAEARLLKNDGCCWTSRIEDSHGCCGLLSLELPQQAEQDKFFEPIRALAEQIGGLMARVLDVEGGLESSEREVSALLNLNSKHRGDQTLQEILQHLLSAAAQLTGYRSAAFFLLNSSTNKLRMRVAYGLESETLPATTREIAASQPDMEALAHGGAIVNRTSLADDRWLPSNCQSGICVPVQTTLVPMGTLWVYDRRMRQDYGRSLEVLKVVAGHISAALERLVLLRESESQHRMVCELRIASEGQLASEPAELPDTCGFVTAARCISRHEVGGDLCELISLTDQTTGIAVGDAVGNNVSAALVMSAVRGALRTVSGRRGAHDWHPAVTMERLNSALHAITGAMRFMSLCYAVYDATDRKFTYSNAGHPAPILMRQGTPIVLESHGLLLGILDDAAYEFSIVDIQPGDLLVMYSDGISEAMNSADELFGTEGVIEAIRSSPSDQVQDLLDHIWLTSETHCGPKSIKKMDDRTLLVIRFQ